MPKKTKSKKTKSKKKKSIKKKIKTSKGNNNTNNTNKIDVFNVVDNYLSLDDVSKDGIIEYIKNKLLQNIINTRYSYLTWFNRFSRNYELVDFLTSYIKAFLHLNNYTINEIYLYVRDNNIKSYSDFNDYFYIKNKMLLLRNKLIDSLDKYIIKGTPPIYYTDIYDILGLKKNIYILQPSSPSPSSSDIIKKDILKEVDEKIKKITPAPAPAVPSISTMPPADVPPLSSPDIILPGTGADSDSDDVAALPPADIPPPPESSNTYLTADFNPKIKNNKKLLNSLYDVFN